MKDFKNENEYGNIKTVETYEGIILKKSDEDYRYYSSSGGSGSGGSSGPSGGSSGPSGGSSGPSGGSSGPSGGSSGPSGGSGGPSGGSGVGSYDCSYCLDTGVLNGSMCPHCINVDWGCESSSASTDLITLNITATCGNSGNMTIELYGEGSTGMLLSKSVSSNRVEASGQISAGTYTIVVWAYLNTGGLSSKEEIIVVKNANSNSASDYNCAYCNNTGLININNKTVCANCEVGNTYIRPIRFAHNYSKQPSGYEIDFAALCEDGWNMCLDLYREDKSWSAPSRCVSALGVANTYYPIGEGKYIIEAKAITSDGYTRTQKEIIEISEAKAHPKYPEGFSYTVNSYDKYNETCNVTMVARYKEAPGTYLDIVSMDGSTEKVVASDYSDGSLVVINADMTIGNYIAKTRINYVNGSVVKQPIEFNVDAQKVNLTLVVTNKSFDETTDKCCIGVSVCASSSNYLNNLMVSLYDENGEELLDTSEEDNCEFYVDEGSYRLKVESSCTGTTYLYGDRYVQFDVEKSSVGHEVPLSDIPTTNAPGGGGGPVGGITPDVEDDINATYNIQYVGNNTFNLTINYNGEKAIKYDVVPKYIRNASIVVGSQSGTYTTSTEINLYEGVYRIDITTVEGNELLKKQLFAVEEIKDENETVTDRVIHYNTAQPTRKFLLLYIAGGETVFQENEVANIVQTTGATDIVILTNCSINHYNNGTDNDLIMSSEKIDNWINEKETDEYPFAPTDKDKIILEMKNAVSAVEESGKENYNNYIHCIKNLKDLLLLANSNLKIWVGIPQMLSSEGIGNCQPAAELYIDYYKLLVDNIMNNKEINDSSFEGFYYGDEVVATWYTEFDYDISENFNNVVVKNMSYMSDYIRNTKKKKFMWIPFYQVVNEDKDEIEDNVKKRTRFIVNNTDLFDYIILQPSSYFNYQKGLIVEAENIEYVRKCVEQGICLTKSEAQASYDDTYTEENVLGMEMEIDDAIDPTNPASEEARALYGEYAFQYVVMKKKDAPVAFYAGVTASVNNTNVLNEISELYNN